MSAPTPSDFVQVPGRLDQIAVGYGVDSGTGNGVWGLAGSQPYRFNFTSNAFEPVPGRLTSISVVDRSNVWGLNSTNIFWFDPGSNNFVQVPGQLTSISVGLSNDSTGSVVNDEVWGVNANGDIFRYVTRSHPFVR